VLFAWVLTRTNRDSIAAIFSASSVWWNGVVSSCNAPPVGNHLQILFTRAQDQPSKKKFTHPILFPFLTITNDPATMIRVLMYNGEWVWFDRDWLPLLNMSAEEFQRFMQGLFNPEIQNQLRTNDEDDFRRYMEEVLSILNPVTQPRINDEPNPNDPSEDLD
jgi:hypothetical protein